MASPLASDPGLPLAGAAQEVAEDVAAAAPPPPPAVQPLSRGYRRYALGVLLIVYTLNFLDRQVVSILAEPIKNDLGLLDWQLGLMTGLAFALLYTVLGIPLARFAERSNRPYVIGGSVAVWSVFTALCGAAQNFWQLVAARVGVGVGEAGCTPPAMSLITDYTPKAERASALSVYLLGAPIGGLIGMAMGGLVADAHGWRAAFLVAGLPGLVFAAVVAFTLVEPRKKLRAAAAAVSAQAMGLKETLQLLQRSRTYWLVTSGVALKAFISYGTTAFMASFFFRNHTAELAELAARFGLGTAGFLGLALGLFTGVTSAIGTLLGGYVSDHFARKSLRAYAIIPAFGSLAAIPFTLFALNAPSVLWALGVLVVPSLLNSLWSGPSYATIQGLAPANGRATATAILLFVANLIGLGLGPLGVGAISDLISHLGGHTPAEGVRYSLMAVALLGLPSAWLFWTARKTIVQETVS